MVHKFLECGNLDVAVDGVPWGLEVDVFSPEG